MKEITSLRQTKLSLTPPSQSSSATSEDRAIEITSDALDWTRWLSGSLQKASS